MQVIVVHVPFLADNSHDLFNPSANIDSAKTALQRIGPFLGAFGQSPEETLWIFKIDYDRQSAGVTNGEHLPRPLAVRGAERTGESKPWSNTGS